MNNEAIAREVCKKIMESTIPSDLLAMELIINALESKDKAHKQEIESIGDNTQKSFTEQLNCYTQIAFENSFEFVERFTTMNMDDDEQWDVTSVNFERETIEVIYQSKGRAKNQTVSLHDFIQWADGLESEE